MVEVDLTTIVLPILIPVGIGLFFAFVKKVGKTADGTLTGTLEIKHVQTDLSSFKMQIEKGFEKLEAGMAERETKHDNELNKIWEKMSDINTTVKLNSYRIESLERERIRYYKDDKSKGTS